MRDKNWTPSRRTVVKGIGAAVAAPLAAPFVAPALAADNKPIRFAVIAAQIADHTDYLNGAMLAADEINAAGGVNGRPIKIETHDIDLLTPEGTQAAFGPSWTPNPRDRLRLHPGSPFRRSRRSATTRRPT